MRDFRSRSSAISTSAVSPTRLVSLAVLIPLLVSVFLLVAGEGLAAGQAPFRLVILDAGHGGKDEGATGVGGILEKEVVLDVARRLEKRLVAERLRVVLTREDDAFVPLEVRTSRANDARGDLFISIHANASTVRRAKGVETYFVSLEASDSAARRVADFENEALTGDIPAAPAADPFLALLGDMISTDHMVESNNFAKLAQETLANVEATSSRGVKQAPFVVLMGVQMPAVLVEIGFLSNGDDAGALGTSAYRDRIVDALASAIVEFGKRYDARRGLAAAN
jgi:N-acetylmuramoyl-L-alanine amidase